MKWLKHIWHGLLVYRFLVPVYDSPMLHLFSDPARHWQNGVNLLKPDIMGSIDPKLYQLYVYIIYQLSFNRPEAVAVFTGLLCVAMAVVWYRVCRELFAPLPARVLGCIFAICPSFTAMYTLFLNETLMMVLFGAALWQTLRAIRKQDAKVAALAVILWVLACFTRTMMVPLAVASIWYLCAQMPRPRWRLAALSVVFSVLLAIPAGWHSWQKLHVFAPLGFPALNEFYFYTGSKVFEINTEQGLYGFSSPSFHYPVGMPFFEYHSCRTANPVRANINTQYGWRDWQTEIARVKASYDLPKFWCGLKENIVFLGIANSWPDSAVEWSYSWLYAANFHLRWLWIPLMLLLLFCAPMVRRNKQEQLVLCLSLGLLLLLIFQQMVMNEGRYRKPLEALLVICAYILSKKPSQKEEATPMVLMWQFIWQIYLRPVWMLFLKKQPAPKE